MIDTAHGFAYFGTTYASSVVKVKLSDFTRVGALTLSAGENYLYSAVIDPAGGYAYFGTGTSPGRVVKVRLSDFTRSDALTPGYGSENNLYTAVMPDTTNGLAYFGAAISPGRVVKINASAALGVQVFLPVIKR
ncbi:MAG: hypothetical protein IPN59_13915 [Holophaga sp.]|nr:hypothetical protein [Holophaga sp.]